MPKIGHIKARRHDILFDLSTGEYTVEKRRLLLNRAPEYDPDCATTSFNRALWDVFRLEGESDEIVRHLYETMGQKLLFPNERELAFWGYGDASQQIVTTIRGVVPAAKNALIVDFRSPLSNCSIWRLLSNKRWNVFPVGRHCTKATFLFADAMENETPGIFRKSIEGLSRLIKRGDFNEPETCRDAAWEMFRLTDPVDRFVEYQLVVAPHLDICVSLSDAYARFVEYYGGIPSASKEQLSRRLMDYGARPKYNSSTRKVEVWGIGLTPY
ncbi:MAG: hypothetical protein JXX14_06360 [Deltaproteobacteria bacterium]|nr:hypothetical protein [Deltaproteobacteria bacterium]